MDPSEIQFNPKKSWFSAHHVLGWVFLVVVAAAAVAGIYYWQTTSNLPYGYQAPKHDDVLGTDSNNNGVRDDVEQYILRTYSDVNVQQALMQEATAIQSALKDSNNKNLYSQDVIDSQTAVNCIYYVDKKDAYNLNALLESTMINTPARLKLWLQINNNSTGSTSIKSLDAQKQDCKFKTDQTSVDTSKYSDNNLRFQIYLPSGFKALQVPWDKSQLQLGRRGGIVITNEANVTSSTSVTYDSPVVSVSVYSDKSALEKDFSGGGTSTIDSTMKVLGLNKTVLTINGNTVPIYYGVRLADVPGGGPSWPYVGAEFKGPTYAYFVEIYNISTAPNNSEIQKYLQSFSSN